MANNCEEEFIESDCVLGVDVIESEVLIDGRDMHNEESLRAENIEARHYEDERTDVDHQYYTAKRKRRKYGKETTPSQHTTENVQPTSHRKFSIKKYFNQHVIIHTGEKPYECGICHRRFNRKAYLYPHFVTHTGEKPFKCEICNFECNQKANLLRHLKKHTGEKSFRCEVCNFECNQKVNLQKHLKRHNPVKEVDDDMMLYVRNDEIYVAELY